MGNIVQKVRASRNRTLTIDDAEKVGLINETIQVNYSVSKDEIEGKIIFQDFLECAPFLPRETIDLLIIDPPYNLTKQYSKSKFKKMNSDEYEKLVDVWIAKLVPCLKKTATIYVCCDWGSSNLIFNVLQKYFFVRNRITWEREKGRGAKTNWKNCSEDIWFCTMSDDYYFDVNAVKLKRKVVAPYRNENGVPKDWQKEDNGNFRLTHPSNLWTDISIPFWSMPENTDHPTQKPEKLIAKLILASSRKGDFVFDPFVGSGTTCVVANKLDRKFCGVEIEREYCQMAVKRIRKSITDKKIQGFHDGYFWERNSLSDQKIKSG